MVRYPDIQNLEVGQEIGRFEKRPDQVQIARFAGATGDFTPIHIDNDIARRVGLDGTIAHGMLITGYVSNLLTDYLGNPGFLKSLKVRFAGMVKPEDKLTVYGVLTKKEKVGEQYIANFEVTVENEKGVKVQVGSAEALVPVTLENHDVEDNFLSSKKINRCK